MKLKKLNLFNFTWKLVHVIALIVIFVLFAIKCFAGWIELGHPLDIHAPNGEELLMEEKAKEMEERVKAVEEKYDQRKENIQKWYEEDDYCDKDLRDRVLDKTKQDEKREKQDAKQDVTWG